jgi:hypothetical protein
VVVAAITGIAALTVGIVIGRSSAGGDTDLETLPPPPPETTTTVRRTTTTTLVVEKGSIDGGRGWSGTSPMS